MEGGNEASGRERDRAPQLRPSRKRNGHKNGPPRWLLPMEADLSMTRKDQEPTSPPDPLSEV